MKLPSLQSGGLIPTYACSSSCAHCLYSCSPKRDNSYIDRATAREYFEKVRRLGCRVMHIGGGEPFLRPESLYQVLESAREADIFIEYVETNSSWYTSAEHVRLILDAVRSRGVDTLLLSISPFHNEHIPFSKVLDLMKTCEERGMGVFPWTMTMASDVRSMDPGICHKLSEYTDRFGSDYVVDAMNRYGVVPGGTALRTLEPLMKKRSTADILTERSPCERLIATTHFHVDLYGNYVPCLCPGLSIRIEDIGRELSDSDYPLLNTLLRDGVAGLYEVAVSEYGFTPREGGYILPCDLCHHIRKHLAVDRKIDSHELQPVEFYREEE